MVMLCSKIKILDTPKTPHHDTLNVAVPLRKATVEDFYYVSLGEKKWNVNMQYFVLNKNNHLESYFLRPPIGIEKRQELKQLLDLHRVYIFKPTELDDPEELIKIVK